MSHVIKHDFPRHRHRHSSSSSHISGSEGANMEDMLLYYVLIPGLPPWASFFSSKCPYSRNLFSVGQQIDLL